MKILKTNPGAKRLIESLRNMGYDCSTAIADLVDNSIAANASEIHIDIITKQDSKPAMIVIADNGKGMDRDELHEAMRFGAFKEYLLNDLGKYGLGLKTASLSQCRTLTVGSKAKHGKDIRPRRIYMRWDLDHVYKTDDWDLLAPTEDEFESWETEVLSQKVAQENGTVVLWTNLDDALLLLSDPSVRDRENFLAHLIEEISNHLRMVFHRFMQGGVTGHRKLNIYVCGQLLIPWDPFCRNEETQELEILHLPVVCVNPEGLKMKDTITISPFILPREDEFSSPSVWRAASGPRNWNQQQGFYFYRNNRLLQAGGWSWLRSVDEHTKLLRVAVDFSRNLDSSLSINITKMRAGIPAEIREKVASQVSVWAKTARSRYDGAISGAEGNIKVKQEVLHANFYKEHNRKILNSLNIGPFVFSQSTSDNEFTITQERGSEEIKITFPRRHELSEIFALGNNSEEKLRKLCLITLSFLEEVYKGKIKSNSIPIRALKRIYHQSL